ncbi:MAG: hypothetical protein JNM48_11090 [Rhodospirillales bacterium]|nr:hypothetical protein [Rhodospirillales bacterium]
MARQARIERRVWDADRQIFAATGEAMDGEVAALEHLAEKLSAAGGRYLQGPVPWPWIIAAAALPGRALIVGLCLWRLAGATRNRTVVFGNSDLASFGIDRATKSRALAVLEDAGLITVARHPGRFPVVTLLASPAERRRSRTSPASLATTDR